MSMINTVISRPRAPKTIPPPESWCAGVSEGRVEIFNQNHVGGLAPPVWEMMTFASQFSALGENLSSQQLALLLLL